MRHNGDSDLLTNQRYLRRFAAAATAAGVLALAGDGPARAATLGATQQDAGLSCKAILAAGASTGDGVYWIDPNGGDRADAFQAYCDMTTDGGGWTLAVNSVAGEEPVTNDMTSNTGVPAIDRGHTRNLANLAINNDAEIRYLLDDSPRGRMFHAKFTGRFHTQLPVFMLWTPLSGHVPGSDTLLADQFGREWSTSLSDRDGFNASCANLYGGVPWHYGTCWNAMPADPRDGSSQGPPANGGGITLSRFSIFVREAGTLPEPSTEIAPSFGLTENLPTGGGPTDVAIGDFDNDGKPDILSANTIGGLSTFTVRYANGTVLQQPAPPGPHYIATGQLTTGDNRLDFALTSASGRVTAYLNQGGSFVSSSFSGCVAAGIATGDFDQNGNTDIALACGGGPVTLASGNGSGVFLPFRSLLTNVNTTSLAVADFNSDGDLDLVVTGGSTGCFNVFIGGTGFNFVSVRQCVSGFLGAVVAGDWSGDGKPDLVAGGSSMITSLRNVDGVHFSAAALFGAEVADVALADVDGNGRLDLIVAHTTPVISIGLGTEDGAFAFSFPPYATSSAPRSLAVGDLNGDGRPDIVSADTATDSVSVFTNTFDGNVAPLASNGTLTVMEGTTESGTLNATDPEGAPLTFELWSTGSKGTATLMNASTGAFSYSANPGASGTDAFTFAAFDGEGTGAATITIMIVPKHTPEVRWANPAAVGYGTVLGAPQLNATANVDGTFTYSPAAGTVLGAGTAQPLNVTFTPTDGAHYRAVSVTAFIDVLRAPLTVRTVDASIVFGQSIPVFTATFAGFVNGDTPASLAGVLNFTGPSSTNAGVYPITPGGLTSANYALGFQAGTLTIAKLSTTTVALMAMTDGGTVSALHPFKLTGSVASAAAGAGHPTGQVRFFDNGTAIGTADIIAPDYAVLTMSSVVPGPHAFTASYLGDGNFAPSTSAPTTLTVRPLASSTFTLAFATNSPTAFGQRATFAALVIPLGGASTPTGTVAFIDGITVLGSAPLSGGVATFSTTALPAGPHVIVAVYQGAGTHGSSVSSPTVHNVYSGTPTLPAPMTLAASASPTVVGQPVTFTVTVTPTSGAPTGRVLFLANNILLGTATLATTGGAFQAALPTTALPLGTHVISAVYEGDGVFAATAAGPILHQVR